MTQVNENAEAKLVTMADGSTMEFSSRASKKTSINLEEGTVSFFLSTGEIYLINSIEIPGCSEYFSYPMMVKRFILDGIRGRIIGTLNNTVGELSLSEAIVEAIASVKEGRVRAAAVKGTSLTREERAYAMLWVKHPTVFSEVQGTMSWDDITSTEVKNDIISAWKDKTKKQRGAIKRNPWFMHFFAAMSLDLPIDDSATSYDEGDSN